VRDAGPLGHGRILAGSLRDQIWSAARRDEIRDYGAGADERALFMEIDGRRRSLAACAFTPDFPGIRRRDNAAGEFVLLWGIVRRSQPGATRDDGSYQ